MDTQNLLQEFDRQVTNLLQKGYPQSAKITEQQLLEKINPLRSKLNNISAPKIDIEKGILPFVIVVSGRFIAAEDMMKSMDKNGVKGVTILRPHSSKNFTPIEDVSIPESDCYLLLAIDRGKETINIPPNEAMIRIKQSGRSPLTIDEGIAIITHFPDFLMKNNCFSLLASRTGNDQRVPAIWINGKKEPNLGWCWDGNPHTWLGSASGKQRIS